MLRIKKELWKDFIKNHNKLGFKKKKRNHDYYEKKYYKIDEIYKNMQPKITAIIYGENCLEPRTLNIEIENGNSNVLWLDVLDSELDIVYQLHDYLEIVKEEQI